MRTKRLRAFSLVEMIVVMMIVTALVAAFYATLSQGLRLWRRGSADRGQWKVDLFLEKITGQIRNAAEDSLWRLRGSKTTLDFATVTGEKRMPQPVYLRYAFNSSGRTLETARFFPVDLRNEKLIEQPLSTVLDMVDDFDIEYYAFDAKTKKHRWFQKWDQNCLPETIKIAIKLQEEQSLRMVRMIDIPAGKACPE